MVQSSPNIKFPNEHNFIFLYFQIFDFTTLLAIYYVTITISEDTGSAINLFPSYLLYSIVHSMFSLYWSLFGLMPREAVQSNAIPRVLESAGTLLYASFYVFCVVVLLNALIAVMSNVYNIVEVKF